MNALQKTGGAGSLVMAALFVATILIYLVALPAQGIGPNDLTDPAKVLPAASSLMLTLANLLNLLYGLAAMLMVPALHGRLREAAPALSSIAAVAGVVAIALFIGSGVVLSQGTIELGKAYAQNASSAMAAFVPLRTIAEGMGIAAFIAFGLWAFLFSWAAVRTALLPRGPAYLGLLFGVSVLLVVLNILPVPLAFILGVVWFAWLGLALWREPARQPATALASA